MQKSRSRNKACRSKYEKRRPRSAQRSLDRRTERTMSNRHRVCTAHAGAASVASCSSFPYVTSEVKASSKRDVMTSRGRRARPCGSSVAFCFALSLFCRWLFRNARRLAFKGIINTQNDAFESTFRSLLLCLILEAFSTFLHVPASLRCQLLALVLLSQRSYLSPETACFADWAQEAPRRPCDLVEDCIKRPSSVTTSVTSSKARNQVDFLMGMRQR